MYVCLCHGITENQIRSCVQAGARTLCDLRGQLGVATQCGSCEGQACEVLDETLKQGFATPCSREGRELTTSGER